MNTRTFSTICDTRNHDRQHIHISHQVLIYQSYSIRPVPDMVGKGYSTCDGNDLSWIKNAASFFGYASTERMLVSFGYKYDKGTNTYYHSSVGVGATADMNTVAAAAYAALQKQWGGSFEWTNAQDYWLLQAVFKSACEPKEDTSGNASAITVKLPDSSNPAKTTSKKYTISEPNKIVYIKPDYGVGNGGDSGRVTGTCSSIAEGINDKASAYEKYLAANASRVPSKSQVESSSSSDSDDSDDDDGKTTCSPDIGGASWIICPVMTFMGNINDKTYSIVAELLEIKSSNLSSSGSGANAGAYEAWKVFRDYANVAFVIIMILIILSQVSNIGISNYGIKTMLPRLIAAAILVNMSFLICQFAVDVSNLLGYAIKSLFDGITSGLTSKVGTTVGGAQSGMWAIIIAGVLGGGAATVAIGAEGIFGLLALLVPVVLSALLALATILLILVARQAIVVLLAVIAPLAFVAYVLPNTRSLMNKWWHMFYTMLLLFPIVSAVFGASNLAGAIVGSADGTLWTIVALGITAVPMFVVPGLLKGALNATGALGAKVQSIGNKATGFAGGKAKEAYGRSNTAQSRKMRQAGKEQYRRRRLTERATAGQQPGASRWQRFNSRRLGGLVRATGAQRYAGERFESAALGQMDKDREEDIKNASVRWRDTSTNDAVAMATTGRDAAGRQLNESDMSALTDKATSEGSFDQRRQVMAAHSQRVAEAHAAGNVQAEQTAARMTNRAVKQSYAKGDQHIYGNGFGDVAVAGNMGSEQAFTNATVENIQAGNVTADDIVRGNGSARFIANSAQYGVQHGTLSGQGFQSLRGEVAKASTDAGTSSKFSRSMRGSFTSTGLM